MRFVDLWLVWAGRRGWGVSLKVRAGSRREKSLVGGGEVLKSLGGVDKTGVGKW